MHPDQEQVKSSVIAAPSYGQGSPRPVPSRKNTLSGSNIENRWGIILAGGDGSRLLSLTCKIAGDDRPKQFCPIISGNTLLDETRRRVALALSPAKTMFVLTQKHERYFNETLVGVPKDNLIVQPKNVGTAPAILYSLLRLKKINPTATVAFFPCDHYFSDDRAFMANVNLAFEAASRQPDLVILLGIEPDCPDEEYGWIEPERETSKDTISHLCRVRRFWEKPSSDLSRVLMNRGCLWNSFVMVGAVAAFLNLIRRSTSELYTKFSAIESKLSTPEERTTIEAIYVDLADTNFSREVLQSRPADLAVLRVDGSTWSDLGSPHRVYATISAMETAIRSKPESTAERFIHSSERNYERARICSSEVV